MRHILHITVGLGRGGAERMLEYLSRRLVAEGHSVTVVSLTGEGALGPRMREAGVEVVALNMGGLASMPRALWSLRRTLARAQPDIVHSWLYHADFAALVGIWPSSKLPLVWGVHVSDLSASGVSRFSRAMARLNRWGSGRPQAIVCCSQSAARAHQALGYSGKRMVVLTNGIDSNRFCPEASASETAPQAASGGPVIGVAARFDEAKDFETLFRAFAILRQIRRGPVRLVVCGEGFDSGAWNRLLHRHVEQHHRSDIEHLGALDDMPAFYRAATLVTLSSVSEALPLSLLEAMACGVPVVGTDVGDVRRAIGPGGLVVSPSDPRALAATWNQILDDPEPYRSAARAHVVKNYDAADWYDAHLQLYARLTPSLRSRPLG